MLPWSVTAIAGIPYSAAAFVIAPIFAAPSSIEYSLCTCRCTKESDATDRVYGGATDTGF
ncbi:hypothetical protein [Microbacterium aurum]